MIKLNFKQLFSGSSHSFIRITNNSPSEFRKMTYAAYIYLQIYYFKLSQRCYNIAY